MAGVAGEVNRLPALLGVASALGLWMGAASMQDAVKQQEQKLEAAGQAVLPRTAQTLPEAERSAAAARQQRAAVETALQSAEPLPLTQARVLYELRQSCAAEGIQGCVVKYSDDAARPEQRPVTTSARSPADKASAATLADLGLGRARAVVSGSFQDLEFRNFINKLTQRSDDGRWRVTALVVRNNTFEIEAELILRPTSSGGGKLP